METNVRLDAEGDYADLDDPFALCSGLAVPKSLHAFLPLLGRPAVTPAPESPEPPTNRPRVTIEPGVGVNTVRLRALRSDGTCFYEATLDLDEWKRDEIRRHAKNLKLRALRKERQHLRAV